MSEWLLFNTKWAIFQQYHGGNKLYFDEIWWQCLLCTRSTCWVGLPHWNNSLWIDMSLHLDILFWFWASQPLFLLLGAACSAEKEQIPISVWPDQVLNQWSTVLKASMLTITPLMWFLQKETLIDIPSKYLSPNNVCSVH